jgi:hypothetical protein
MILSNVFLLPLVTLYSSCNDKGKSKLPDIETLYFFIVSICLSIEYKLVLI